MDGDIDCVATSKMLPNSGFVKWSTTLPECYGVPRAQSVEGFNLLSLYGIVLFVFFTHSYADHEEGGILVVTTFLETFHWQNRSRPLQRPVPHTGYMSFTTSRPLHGPTRDFLTGSARDILNNMKNCKENTQDVSTMKKANGGRTVGGSRNQIVETWRDGG